MKYILKCINCGFLFQEARKLDFSCPKGCGSLVKSVYSSNRITFKGLQGIWRYSDWLPLEKTIPYEGGSVTYKSKGLAEELGLNNLYISFSGFWPEVSAWVKTCTFKEFEALLTVNYAKENGVDSLIIASAGNTASAFAYLASMEKIKVILTVPEKPVEDMIVPYANEEYVKIVGVKGEFSDALSLAKKIHSSRGIPFDGGGKSVPRRDGLGTVLLESVEKIKRIPRHYFQAVSSGTGAIATFEVAERLLNDGRFGETLPKLHLSQNYPFLPIVRAWKDRRREIVEDDVNVRDTMDILYAKVLSNKEPLYPIKGGVFDTLQTTEGETYGITNEEAVKASKLFEDLEGVDIVPAASIATASFIKAVEQGKLNPQDEVLLNITGGGIKRVKEEVGLEKMKTCMRVDKDVSLEELEDFLRC